MYCTYIIKSNSRSIMQVSPGSIPIQVALGGYILQDLGIENSVGSGGPLPHPTLIIIGTGTEVYLAMGAAQILCSESTAVWVRVVSMPSCELFDRQSLEYQRSVLISGAPVMSVEASGVVRWLPCILYIHTYKYILHLFNLCVDWMEEVRPCTLRPAEYLRSVCAQ